MKRKQAWIVRMPGNTWADDKVSPCLHTREAAETMAAHANHATVERVLVLRGK